MIEMGEGDFERLVVEGIEAIPERYREEFRNIAVVIESRPNRHHKKVGGIEDGWTLYGLYEGVPLDARGDHYMFTVPDKISIFREPILEAAESVEDAREIVANTVWHEFGHYFGLDEDEVEKREEETGRTR